MYGPVPHSAPPASFITAAAAALATFRAKIDALHRPARKATPYWAPFYSAAEDAQIAIFCEGDRATWGVEIAFDRDHIPASATIYATAGKSRSSFRTLGSFTFDVPLTATETDIRAAWNTRVRSEVSTLSALLLPEK